MFETSSDKGSPRNTRPNSGKKEVALGVTANPIFVYSWGSELLILRPYSRTELK